MKWNIYEWERKICSYPPSDCYSNKDPLIFLFLGQKVVFMSESPWNFPRNGETVEEFIEKTLQELFSERVKKCDGVPQNIFEFICQTLTPPFSSKPKKEDIEEFLQTIYWIHIAKKTLKGLSSSEKYRRAKKCLNSTIRELRDIDPELLIIATSIGLRALFGIGFKEAFEIQAEKLRSYGRLLTVGELSSNLGFIENCEVAVFPNPSPKNGWKNYAYIVNGTWTGKVLDHIHKKLMEIT